MMPSEKRMVKSEGPPLAEPWNQSPRGGIPFHELNETPAVGGTKVREAKRLCISMMSAGGSDISRIRMAMASDSGQALRMVIAMEKLLLAERPTSLEVLTAEL